ncbi:MAG: hypothetical protein AAB019_05150, partial [Planctomycetota bacterium]
MDKAVRPIVRHAHCPEFTEGMKYFPACPVLRLRRIRRIIVACLFIILFVTGCNQPLFNSQSDDLVGEMLKSKGLTRQTARLDMKIMKTLEFEQ